MSIAEKNGYPPAFARAMITKEVVVLEVMRKGQKMYIEPADKKIGDKVLRTICEDGEILTITAKDALDYGFASGNPNSREELLADLGYKNAQYVENVKIPKAEKDYIKVNERVHTMVNKVQELGKTIENQMVLNPTAAKKTTDNVIKKMEYLVKFSKTQKDVPYPTAQLQKELSRYKSLRDTLNATRRR